MLVISSISHSKFFISRSFIFHFPRIIPLFFSQVNKIYRELSLACLLTWIGCSTDLLQRNNKRAMHYIMMAWWKHLDSTINRVIISRESLVKFNAAIAGRCVALKFSSFNEPTHSQCLTDNGFCTSRGRMCTSLWPNRISLITNCQWIHPPCYI